MKLLTPWKNSVNLDPSKFNKWTVIRYLPADYGGHRHDTFRAMELATGRLGPYRKTYEEAENDFETF